MGIFRREIDLIELEGSIQTKVRYNLQRGQREMYLREQLKAIQSELNIDESGDADSDEYYARIEAAKLPAEVSVRLHEEDAKLARMPFGSIAKEDGRVAFCTYNRLFKTSSFEGVFCRVYFELRVTL